MFSPSGAIALTIPEFAESIKPTLVTSLTCIGDEDRLPACIINNDNSASCGQFEDAGIVCQGYSHTHTHTHTHTHITFYE